MKKMWLCLAVMLVWVVTAFAVQPIHSVSVNINAQVTVREIFRLTVEPTEIDFGAVDIETVSGEVAVKTKGETNCGRHISLQIKGIDFTQPLGQVLNIIDIENVTMKNTLASGQGHIVSPLTLTEQYQEFAKSTGNPHGYIEVIVSSLYTIYVPAVDAGVYQSVFTITMSE